MSFFFQFVWLKLNLIIIVILKECLILITFSQELLEEVYRILNDFLQTRFWFGFLLNL